MLSISVGSLTIPSEIAVIEVCYLSINAFIKQRLLFNDILDRNMEEVSFNSVTASYYYCEPADL